MQIAVIDLGIGNLRSVEQALSTVAPDADVVITSDVETLDSADRLVLPGQGSVNTWFAALQERELEDVVKRSIEQKPLLGICVGMQALFSRCEEGGEISGLNLFDGNVRHFKNFHTNNVSQPALKIPQMGWNQVSQTQEHPLWQGIENDAYFYFVHSYCANATSGLDLDFVYGSTDYGHQFISAVGKGNIFAVQFHPEKSHRDGLRLLKNFTQWNS